MTYRHLLLVNAVALLLATAAQAQQTKLPRLPDGKPDLQGNWTNATLTSFERPAEYGTRRAMTKEEAGKIEKADENYLEEFAKPTDPKLGIQDLPTDCGRGFVGVSCGYNHFWIDPGTQVMQINGEYRTSMVTEPANGRVPPLLPAAQQRNAARMAELRRGGGANDGPEMRSLGERCILSFGSSAGPPMLPLLYNNNYQIVQTQDTVMILVEMVHDARIVRMNAKHRPSSVRTWMGDSIGRWEGDTLVVETTNFRVDQSFRGASENLKIVERFTRSSPEQIVYGFRIEDPTSFAQPWGGEVAFNATKDNIYEYACHEGNYALPGILAGAREAEREAERVAAGGAAAKTPN